MKTAQIPQNLLGRAHSLVAGLFKNRDAGQVRMGKVKTLARLAGLLPLATSHKTGNRANHCVAQRHHIQLPTQRRQVGLYSS